jgi:hypothetical protein
MGGGGQAGNDGRESVDVDGNRPMADGRQAAATGINHGGSASTGVSCRKKETEQ